VACLLYELVKGWDMPIRTCLVCEFSTTMDEWDSFSRQHPRCSLCGLLFGNDHIANEIDGLCQFCNEEDTSNVDLDKEDAELDN